MLVDYIAKRSLKAGHPLDSAQQFDVNLSTQDRAFRAIGRRAVSLSGKVVDTVHRYDTIYQLVTVLIEDASVPDNADLTEFLDSVASGETFQLDLEAPAEDYVLENQRSPYRKTRVGSTNIFRYSFVVRKLL